MDVFVIIGALCFYSRAFTFPFFYLLLRSGFQDGS